MVFITLKRSLLSTRAPFPQSLSSPVQQFASSSAPVDASTSFHLPGNGLFKIIPIPSDNPEAPPLYQIVPQLKRIDNGVAAAAVHQQYQYQPPVAAVAAAAQVVPATSYRHAHHYQTDFGLDEPWRWESYKK